MELKTELTAQKVKDNPGMYRVGLTDFKKVFIPSGSTDINEEKYKRFLKVEANSKKEAKHIVLTKLLSGEYQIIVDQLWAWR
jgi:hypothetical protein